MPVATLKSPGHSNSVSEVSKRKEPPQSSSNSQHRARDPKRVKLIDARTIVAQKGVAALNNGELDLQAFLKSREFEIKALQDGMARSKSSRTTRAFQQVPRDLRRRTASHNIKRVPKRLHRRAAREMREDNTPTVDPSKRNPRNSRGRIRAETAKRLGILAAKKKLGKNQAGIETRPARPKVRRDKLNEPPKPKSKFRKRQIHKTWLPTHMWLAKRAKLTEPKSPLWRFAIPITSSEKSYRPTHGAGGARGCVAWDMSYMSTIELEGPEVSLENLLKTMNIIGDGLWDKRGCNWRQGKRVWDGSLSRYVDNNLVQICPSTIIWCPESTRTSDDITGKPEHRIARRVFVRVHPSAFLEVWEEMLRLSKLQRPLVHIKDLRYEIGSIQITGPGATETLLGILHPFSTETGHIEPHAETFVSLAGITNSASLPIDSLLSFSIFDPRLRYPPRPAQLPKIDDEEAQLKLMETVGSWPVDNSVGSSALFDREARYKATILPSQKALNRRKSLAKPGQYPDILEIDPSIPIMLIASRPAPDTSAQGVWTLLAPWKCILPIWHGIVHYPLSSSGNPRFGGLDELRQLHFENGIPWFPADFPSTAAGVTWEEAQRLRKRTEWERRPKGKRVEWDSLDLGAGRKGEIGRGWACDFERILEGTLRLEAVDQSPAMGAPAGRVPTKQDAIFRVTQVPRKAFELLLLQPTNQLPPENAVLTIRITIEGRGIASTCARIYRLPPPSVENSLDCDPGNTPLSTREAWLALLPNQSAKTLSTSAAWQKQRRIPLNIPLSKRTRLIAQSLLEPPGDPQKRAEGHEHPTVPGEDDLIGFVTTGSFNLAAGKGQALGSVFVRKLLDSTKNNTHRTKGNEGRLCIVRNAGEQVGRLARWEPI